MKWRVLKFFFDVEDCVQVPALNKFEVRFIKYSL